MILRLPPFPPLTWDEFRWTGDLLSVACRDPDTQAPPGEAQARAFESLKDGDLRGIMAAVHRVYPELRARIPSMPALDTVDALQAQLILHRVHIALAEKDGIACVGYEFDCTWDEEHGLGVMTWKGRLLAVNAGDCAYSESDARQGLADLA